MQYVRDNPADILRDRGTLLRTLLDSGPTLVATTTSADQNAALEEAMGKSKGICTPPARASLAVDRHIVLM